MRRGCPICLMLDVTVEVNVTSGDKLVHRHYFDTGQYQRGRPTMTIQRSAGCSALIGGTHAIAALLTRLYSPSLPALTYHYTMRDAEWP